MTTDSATPFWPNKEHWSVAIPLVTPHNRMAALQKDGFVILRPIDVEIPRNEWESSNAAKAPTIKKYVDGVGANFGRVRIIKLEPQNHDVAIRSFHRDDNNRFNPDNEGWVVRSWIELTDQPDSYMLLMDNDADGLPDRSTERRVPLHQGSRFVVDTQRLWHVVVHNHKHPRYALITSFESGPILERWIDSQSPAAV